MEAILKLGASVRWATSYGVLYHRLLEEGRLEQAWEEGGQLGSALPSMNSGTHDLRNGATACCRSSNRTSGLRSSLRASHKLTGGWS